MPEEIEQLYSALRSELLELHIRWKLCKQLFAKNQLRVDLLNKTASTFFSRLQYILVDDVLMGIARLTDPIESCGKKNLCVNLLYERLSSSGFQDLADRIEEGILQLEPQIGPFRQHRNKRIAHRDFEIKLGSGEGTLSGISRKQIEDVLDSLASLLNDVQIHFQNVSTGYKHVVTTRDANTLVEAMKKAYVFHQLMIDDPMVWWQYLENSKFKNA